MSQKLDDLRVEIEAALNNLAQVISKLPEGRKRSLAFTRFEEGQLWVGSLLAELADMEERLEEEAKAGGCCGGNCGCDNK